MLERCLNILLKTVSFFFTSHFPAADDIAGYSADNQCLIWHLPVKVHDY